MLERMNNRLNDMEECKNNPEHRMVEITQAEQQKRKSVSNENSLKVL